VPVVAIVGQTARAARHDDVGAALIGGGAGLPVPFAAVFLAVVGILATGHEYRYGTIQPTLTTLPRRSTVLAAKVAVLAATAVVVAVVSGRSTRHYPATPPWFHCGRYWVRRWRSSSAACRRR
jgi:hypothetical protein